MARVRAMTERDGSDVLRINAASRPGVSPLDEGELARLRALSALHLVAVDAQERVVGYALVLPRGAAYDGEEFHALERALPEPFLYVDQVAVAAGERRHGVGRALYAAVEALARRRGAAHVCCEVNTLPPNPGSAAFHRRLGFFAVGAMATRDGREVALYARRLGEEPASTA